MIAGYIRVSSEGQRENYSVDIQREKAKAFSARLKEPIQLYDEVKSGKNLERPELLRMFEDIKGNKITKVWVIEFSRITRDIGDANEISKLFRKHNVALYVNDALVDLSRSENRLLYNINAAVSSNEREKLSERVKRAKNKQKEEGYRTYNNLFGYSYKYDESGKTIWFVNDKEASTVKKLFELYSSGMSVNKIAQFLNDNAYETKRGGSWSATHVVKILSHKEYFGLTENLEGAIIDSKVYPAILPKKERGLYLNQKQKREVPRRNFRVAKTELSGMLTCGNCGCHYYIHYAKHKLSDGTVRDYIRFAHRAETRQQLLCDQKPKFFPKEETEECIRQAYIDAFTDKYSVNAFLEAMKTSIYQSEQELLETKERVERELEAIEKKRKKLINGFEDGLWNLNDIKENMEKLNEDKKKRIAILEKMTSNLAVFSSEYVEMAAKFSEDQVNKFIKAKVEERRMLYQIALSEIKVSGPRVYVNFITGKSYQFKIGEWELRETRDKALRDYLNK
jgi:site-specific DNA recombinase